MGSARRRSTDGHRSSAVWECPRRGVCAGLPTRQPRNLREDARNRIKHLDVHPPEEEGGPPRIILEGNVPQMLRRVGVDTIKKGDAHGAAFLDRVIDS
jgi:hypothetical protein